MIRLKKCVHHAFVISLGLFLFMGTPLAYDVTASFEPSAINVLTWDLQDTSEQDFIPLLYNLGTGSPPVPIVEVNYTSPYSVGPFVTGQFKNFMVSPDGPPVLYDQDDDFAVSMWVQFNKTWSSASGTEVLYSLSPDDTGYTILLTRQETRWYIEPGALFIVGEGLNIGWHFIVTTYDSANKTLTHYIDNSSVSNSSQMTTFTLNITNFGASLSGANPSVDFLINQIKFYNDSLTGADVDLLAANLSASGNYTAPETDWQVHSFPQNFNASLGFGNVFNTTLGTSDVLAGTNFGIRFDPSVGWYSNGYPADSSMLIPGFVLKYKGEYVTPLLIENLPITNILFGFTATNEDACYLYTGGTAAAIDTTDWAADTPDRYTLFLPSGFAPPLVRETNPVLFLGDQIYCTELENLTVHFLLEAEGITDTTVHFPIPLGYYIYNNGTVDYEVNATDTYTSGAPPGLNGSGIPGVALDSSDPMVMVELLLQPWVIVMIMVIGMGIIAASVGGSVLGIAAMVGGMLILTILGILPVWVVIILIVISAFIGAKQMQGMFTPSSQL